jgi:hypothetical protein
MTGPSLICNGIRIGIGYGGRDLWKNETYRISEPNVCVFDPDGLLPLDLQRESLSVKEYPFKDLLFEDVSRDLLAFLLVNTPEVGSLQNVLKMPTHPGFSICNESNLDLKLLPWAVTDEGLCLSTSWNMWGLNFKRLLLATRYNYRQPDEFAALGNVPQTVSADTACLMFNLSGNANSKQRFIVDWVRGISQKQLLTGFQVQGTRLITNSIFAKRFFELSYYPNSLKKSLVAKKGGGKWRFLEDHNCPDTMFKTATFAPDSTQEESEWNPPLCVEYFLNKSEKEPEKNIFERLWKEIIDYPVIPFDLAIRQSKLAKAYEILKPYIEAHESGKSKIGKKDPLEFDQME